MKKVLDFLMVSIIMGIIMIGIPIAVQAWGKASNLNSLNVQAVENARVIGIVPNPDFTLAVIQGSCGQDVFLSTGVEKFTPEILAALSGLHPGRYNILIYSEGVGWVRLPLENGGGLSPSNLGVLKDAWMKF